MSYDIELIDKKTDQVLTIKRPQFIEGGTIKVKYDLETGELVPVEQNDTRINITYNYSRYYYEATEGDSRFAWDHCGEIDYGIRGLYGKQASESIDMLLSMISRITKKYQDKNGNWIKTKRIKKYCFDKNGNEIKDVCYAIANHIEYKEVEKEYEISEGDISSYWEATAANAIKPLWNMIYMATDNFLNENAIWDGD